MVLKLREHLNDDATIAVDVGTNYIHMARHFRVYQPRHLLFSNGQQTLGVGLPWAMAATLVRPGTPVLSVSGDGGFLYSAMELETARRLGCNITHVIMRDNSWDMVAFQRRDQRSSRFASRVPLRERSERQLGAPGVASHRKR